MKWRKEKKEMIDQIFEDRCKEEVLIFKSTIDLVTEKFVRCFHML